MGVKGSGKGEIVRDPPKRGVPNDWVREDPRHRRGQRRVPRYGGEVGVEEVDDSRSYEGVC